MDQAQLQKFITFIDSTHLSEADKNYLIARYGREGPNAELENLLKEKLSKLPSFGSEADTKTVESNSEQANIEQAIEVLEKERDQKIDELDQQFAPHFSELEEKMDALQAQYDTELEKINNEYDEKVEVIVRNNN